jgi:histidinol-phosphate aminotransferase
MASLADQAHVEKSRKVNAEGKEYLYRSFEKMGLHYLLSQANYVLLTDLRHDVEVINQALLQRGVIIRPSAPFGMPQAIRITVGTREENERLVEALSLTLTDM